MANAGYRHVILLAEDPIRPPPTLSAEGVYLLKAPRAIGINREGEDVVQIRHPKMLPQDIDYNLHARGAILEVGRHATTSENLLRRRGHVLGLDPTPSPSSGAS